MFKHGQPHLHRKGTYLNFHRGRKPQLRITPNMSGNIGNILNKLKKAKVEEGKERYNKTAQNSNGFHKLNIHNRITSEGGIIGLSSSLPQSPLITEPSKVINKLKYIFIYIGERN